MRAIDREGVARMVLLGASERMRPLWEQAEDAYSYVVEWPEQDDLVLVSNYTQIFREEFVGLDGVGVAFRRMLDAVEAAVFGEQEPRPPDYKLGCVGSLMGSLGFFGEGRRPVLKVLQSPQIMLWDDGTGECLCEVSLLALPERAPV